MIPANLRLMLSLRFSGKNAGVAQKTSENGDCSKDTGLSHHAALALCRVLVV